MSRFWAALLCLLTAVAVSSLVAAQYASVVHARVCSHGESSISGEMRDGRFVLTSGPSVTGCRP